MSIRSLALGWIHRNWRIWKIGARWKTWLRITGAVLPHYGFPKSYRMTIHIWMASDMARDPQKTCFINIVQYPGEYVALMGIIMFTISNDKLYIYIYYNILYRYYQGSPIFHSWKKIKQKRSLLWFNIKKTYTIDIFLLVLNAGNFWEWSIITSNNHPSNPQQPPATHQFPTFSTSKLYYIKISWWLNHGKP